MTTVTESVPTGYTADPTEQAVSVSATATCGSGDEATVSFHNTPLTNVTVSVDSQVPGGTESVITCTEGDGTTIHSETASAASEGGDDSLVIHHLSWLGGKAVSGARGWIAYGTGGVRARR